jgi:hypothetical protein
MRVTGPPEVLAHRIVEISGLPGTDHPQQSRSTEGEISRTVMSTTPAK